MRDYRRRPRQGSSRQPPAQDAARVSYRRFSSRFLAPAAAADLSDALRGGSGILTIQDAIGNNLRTFLRLLHWRTCQRATPEWTH